MMTFVLCVISSVMAFLIGNWWAAKQIRENVRIIYNEIKKEEERYDNNDDNYPTYDDIDDGESWKRGEKPYGDAL